MKYLMCAIRIVIMCIGLYMMFRFPDIAKPPFISGAALTLVGMYLILQSCSCCKEACKTKKK